MSIALLLVLPGIETRDLTVGSMLQVLTKCSVVHRGIFAPSLEEAVLVVPGPVVPPAEEWRTPPHLLHILNARVLLRAHIGIVGEAEAVLLLTLEMVYNGAMVVLMVEIVFPSLCSISLWPLATPFNTAAMCRDNPDHCIVLNEHNNREPLVAVISDRWRPSKGTSTNDLGLLEVIGIPVFSQIRATTATGT